MSNPNLQPGYARVYLAVPEPIAKRFKERCASRPPRGVKNLGTIACSIINGLSEEAMDALVEWSHKCETKPTRIAPDEAAQLLAKLIAESVEPKNASGDTHYIDRIIAPEIMGNGKKNAS